MSKKLSPMEQEAKLKVLQGCMDDMDGLMGEGLDKKKKMKVSVMSDSPKGLKAGLKKAEEVVGGDHAMMGDSEDEALEEDEMESEEGELSEEELDAKIAELMAKKEKLKV